MILTAVTAFIVLSVLVFVHELGHFLAAKRVGVKVEEFGFGYPPRIWGKKIGGTIYSINWLPFGGFVRLFGEELDQKIQNKEAFFNKSKRARTLVIVAGVFFNFLLAVVIFAVVYSISGIPVQTHKVTILDTVSGSPAQQAGLKSGDVIWEFNQQPIKKSEDLISLTDQNLGKIITLKVEGVERTVKKTSFEYEVLPGENLWGIAQKVYQNGYLWSKIAQDNHLENPGLIFVGQKININPENQEEKLGGVFQLVLTPRVQSPQGEGPLGVIISDMEMKKYPWWQMPFLGIWQGIKEAFSWTVLIVQSLGKMFFDLFAKGVIPQDVAGPVGIIQITGLVAKSGFLNILQFAGFLSINLMVINILPLPALDGGRLVFILYEAVARRKPKEAVERWTNALGMSLLILLLLVATFNDFKRLEFFKTLGQWLGRLWPF
jgi:regulator of sigma E protease